jgi:hypothetical protein
VWEVSLGGFVKLSLIHDFDAIGSPDVFDPRSIPVDGSKGTNTRITARETRLSLGIEGPVEGRDLELFLEGDFFGPGTGTGNTFRLRHAYARYGALLAGQTWTTFMDERNIPPTIDFEHALAAPLVRQGLLRVTTGLSKRSDLAFAVEESDPEVLVPPGVQGAPEKPWPDFGSTAAPFPRVLAISPTGASVSRSKTVTRPGMAGAVAVAGEPPRGM